MTCFVCWRDEVAADVLLVSTSSFAEQVMSLLSVQTEGFLLGITGGLSPDRTLMADGAGACASADLDMEVGAGCSRAWRGQGLWWRVPQKSVAIEQVTGDTAL